MGRVTNSRIRTIGWGIASINETYTYLNAPGVSSPNTSYNVASKTVSYGSSASTAYNYTYNMDASGSRNLNVSNPYSIYQVKEGVTTKATYTYDTLGRLSQEINTSYGYTWTFGYDSNNNITSKTKSGATPKTYAYVYDTVYKDRLVSYDGNSIIYDALGAPTTYLGNTLTWKGYQLNSLAKSGITYNYKYNPDGYRLSKTPSSGTATNYIYEGSRLVRETRGADTIWYLYNQDGIIGFEWNGTSYYYVKNLLGDVTKIVSANNGSVQAEYVYDAWGNAAVSGTNTTLANLNPIRYRSYYYDAESGFYYLNSRYYDPEVGRFISPDVVAENGNLYAYCQNDPVNRTDETGYLSKFWKKALSIAAVVVVTAAIVVVATVYCGPASPYIAGAAIGAGAEMLQQIAFEDKDLTTINYAKVGVAAAAGALSAIPGIGWVGAGLISGASAAAMTAIDGGGTEDIVRSAAIGFATGAVINKLFSGGICFIEGTPVLTSEGFVAIESIVIGTYVWAYNEETGETDWKPVVYLFRNESQDWVGITINGIEIISTPGHKYYLPESKEWISASVLKVGSVVLLSNGSYAIIESVRNIHYDTPQITYNFEVADFHTYYVGAGVLVHNKKCGDLLDYEPIRKGDYRAVINPGETEAPHAHIFKKNNNVGRVFSNGKIDKSLQSNRSAMKFVKEVYTDITEMIKKFYGMR